MPKLKFPDMPTGPLYELKLMLHELHGMAGTPPLRSMAKAVGCSHDKIHKMLTSDEFPADGDALFRLAGWLAMQGPRPRFTEDDEEREREFYDQLDEKWKAAQRYASLPPLPASQAVQVRRQRSRPGPAGGSDVPEGAESQDGARATEVVYRAGGSAFAAQGGSVIVHPGSSARYAAPPGDSKEIFPDPARSRAVLIAAGQFESPHLADLPGTATGAEQLARLLTDRDREGCIPDTELQINPENPRQVLEAIERASQAQDTLLVYFSGHGLITEQGRLTLATRTSDPASRFSSVAWDDARTLIADSPAARSLVLINSCYSGTAAHEPMGTADGAFRLHVSESMTEILTSTGAYEFSFAGRDMPDFTGALLSLLTEGDPNLPETLTTEDIYRGLLNWARRENKPLPQRVHSGHGTLALGRNPAYRGQNRTHPLPIRTPHTIR